MDNIRTSAAYDAACADEEIEALIKMRRENHGRASEANESAIKTLNAIWQLRVSDPPLSLIPPTKGTQ